MNFICCWYIVPFEPLIPYRRKRKHSTNQLCISHFHDHKKRKESLLVSLFSLSLKSSGGLCLKINLPFFSPSFGISIRGKRHTWGRFPYLTHRPSSCILSKYNLTFIESPTRHTQLCFLLVHLFL